MAFHSRNFFTKKNSMTVAVYRRGRLYCTGHVPFNLQLNCLKALQFVTSIVCWKLLSRLNRGDQKFHASITCVTLQLTLAGIQTLSLLQDTCKLLSYFNNTQIKKKMLGVYHWWVWFPGRFQSSFPIGLCTRGPSSQSLVGVQRGRSWEVRNVLYIWGVRSVPCTEDIVKSKVALPELVVERFHCIF